MIMKVDPVGQAGREHRDHSQQVGYCGRLPGAEAASVCDSTIIQPRRLIALVLHWVEKLSWWADPDENLSARAVLTEILNH